MHLGKDFKSISAALGSMLFWSFSFVWVKVAYLAYQPLTVVLLRLCFSVILILSFVFVIRRLQIPAKKDIGIFLLLAFFEPFLYFMGESFGLKYVSSTVAAVIVATIPLVSPIIAWYFFREKLSKMNIVGLFVSFLGVSMVVMNSDLSFSASPKGVILEFFAVFSAVAYSSVLRKLAFRYNTFTIIAFQNLIGIVFFLPFWLIFESRTFLTTPFHSEAFRAILLLSFFASTLAFILFTHSIRNLGINRSNTFVNLIPVFVAIIAYFVLGDRLTFQKIAGISVVIAGLFLAQIKKRNRNLISKEVVPGEG
jgi:drug/metabolite transporter (DMT)-like permease